MFGSIGEKVVVGVISAVALGAIYAAWDAIKNASTGFVVPDGAVVAFDLRSGCPSGWQADFEEAAGKFIIGVGEGQLRYQGPHQPNGAPNSLGLTKVDFGDQGGAEIHSLKIEEVPPHGHGTGMVNIPSPDGGVTTMNNNAERLNLPWLRNGSASVEEGNHDLVIHKSGGRNGQTEPHNNMPPFIALHYCKKE